MADFSQPEGRMYIDGKFVEARSGARFANVNPATEEVIGQVADGGLEDMQAAIAAARRAFDTTGWSTDVALRKRCLEQLQQGLEKEKEQLRKQTIAEVGAPIMLTYGPQGDSVIRDLSWVANLLGRYAFERDLGVHEFFGMKSRRIVRKEATGVVGCITPWNFPLAGEPGEGRAGAGGGQHHRAEARARHAVERDLHREGDGRAHRHPARRLQRGDLARSGARRRAAVRGPARRHALLHRLDRGRPPHHGGGRGDGEEGLPRARRQVGEHRARRREARGGAAGRQHGVHARRPGLRDHHAAPAAAQALRTRASPSSSRPSAA